MVRLFKFIFSKKGLAFFIALFSALFLGVGYYVMDVSASVPCEYLWIEGNTHLVNLLVQEKHTGREIIPIGILRTTKQSP